MLDVVDLVEQIKGRGFSICPALIDAYEVTNYVRHLEPLLEMQQRGDLPNTDKGLIHSPMLLDPIFLNLLDNQTLKRITDVSLGESAIMYAFSSSSIAPHDDNYAGRIHVDCPRVIPNYITNLGVIVALSDFSQENGGTLFLPSSFEMETPPSAEQFRSGAVTIQMRAGDAAFFNTRTWHMSGRNMTTTARHSLTLNFCRSYMRQRFDYPRMIPSDVLETLTEQQRQYLGFFVQMPTSWEEFAAPAELRKYRPGQG